MRAEFQILIGVATATTVTRTTTSVIHGDGEPKIEESFRAEAHAQRLTQQFERDGREQQATCQFGSRFRSIFYRCLRRSMKTNGVNCQISSLGHTSRSPPPAKPQPTANGGR